jgi:hypothetical protein
MAERGHQRSLGVIKHPQRFVLNLAVSPGNPRRTRKKPDRHSSRSGLSRLAGLPAAIA